MTKFDPRLGPIVTKDGASRRKSHIYKVHTLSLAFRIPPSPSPSSPEKVTMKPKKKKIKNQNQKSKLRRKQSENQC